MARTVPVYLRIAASLRAQIASGQLAAGAQLPTEHALARQWNVAHQTARNGLAVLVNEGLVVARRPRGHFVTPREEQLTYALADRGRSADDGADDVNVALIQPGPDIAALLRIGADTTVVVRRSVRQRNGRPVLLSEGHFVLDVVKDSVIMQPGKATIDPDRVLAELGFPQVQIADEITLQRATPDQLHRLDLSRNAVVWVHYATGYTADDQPVCCTVTVLPGSLYRIVMKRDLPWKDQPAPPLGAA